MTVVGNSWRITEGTPQHISLINQQETMEGDNKQSLVTEK